MKIVYDDGISALLNHVLTGAGHPVDVRFFLLRWRDLKARPEQSEGKEQSGGLFLRAWESPWIPGYTR